MLGDIYRANDKSQGLGLQLGVEMEPIIKNNG